MRRSTALLTGALVLAVAPAAGAQTTFTSRADFLAALSAGTTIGFEGLAPAGGQVNVGGSGTDASFGAVTVSTTNPCCSDFFVVDAAYAGGAFSLGSGATFSPQVFGDVNDVTFATPGGFRAFAFDFGFGSGPQTLTVALAGGATFGLTFGGTLPSPDFFGFIADAPVASVTLTSDNDVVILDNVTFGTPTQVIPEPMSIALVGTGLAGLALVARRRRRG